MITRGHTPGHRLKNEWRSERIPGAAAICHLDEGWAPAYMLVSVGRDALRRQKRLNRSGMKSISSGGG
jgi:hypothetical protein